MSVQTLPTLKLFVLLLNGKSSLYILDSRLSNIELCPFDPASLFFLSISSTSSSKKVFQAHLVFPWLRTSYFSPTSPGSFTEGCIRNQDLDCRPCFTLWLLLPLGPFSGVLFSPKSCLKVVYMYISVQLYDCCLWPHSTCLCGCTVVYWTSLLWIGLLGHFHVFVFR